MEGLEWVVVVVVEVRMGSWLLFACLCERVYMCVCGMADCTPRGSPPPSFPTHIEDNKRRMLRGIESAGSAGRGSVVMCTSMLFFAQLPC